MPTMNLPQKFVLCRPQGGLNDMLCQIERCCRYGELTRRTIVVDTAYEHAEYFRDPLSNYFEPVQSRLVLDVAPLADELSQCDVFPASLAGRIHTYRSIRDLERMTECETRNGDPLEFDMQQHYPQRLLVHHQLGGGEESIYALMRMRLVKSLGQELLRRLIAIGPQYVGVHVRHTDYHTDYRQLLQKLMQSGHRRIFLATDNAAVLQDFRNALGRDRVYSFAALPTVAGLAAHRRMEFVEPEVVRRRNRDAILDLIMLALSSQLQVAELQKNANRMRYSGFTTLARNLWRAKIVLKTTLGGMPLDFGLG